jgi:hypothetical protein
VHAHKKDTEHCDREAQSVSVIWKVHEANEDQRATVRHMTEQNKSKYHSHTANYSIREGIYIRDGLTIVKVAQKSVANGSTCDGQG